MFVHTIDIENPRRGILYGPGQQLRVDDRRSTADRHRRRATCSMRDRPGSTWSASIAKRTVPRSLRACPAATRFSRRSSIHLTGRPSSREASTMAHSSRNTNIFWPKPPPTSRAVTRIVALRDLQVAGEEVAGLVHALARADDVELVPRRVPRLRRCRAPPSARRRSGADAPCTRPRARRAANASSRSGDIGVNGTSTMALDGEPHAPCTRCSVSRAAAAKSTTGWRRVEVDLDQVAGVLGDVAARRRSRRRSGRRRGGRRRRPAAAGPATVRRASACHASP